MALPLRVIRNREVRHGSYGRTVVANVAAELDEVVDDLIEHPTVSGGGTVATQLCALGATDLPAHLPVP
jgi:hypothetical protein